MKSRWGDVRAGLLVAVARFTLLQLRHHKMDPRNWRPHILLFVGDPAKRIGLVRLANWFNQNRGLVTASQLVVGDLMHDDAEVDRIQNGMDRVLEQEGLVAFSDVNVVKDYECGIVDVMQADGIAGLKSNTVMFGWPRKRDRLESILRIMRAISKTGKSTIISRLKWAHEPGQEKQVHIWWRGLKNNGDLMLLLAYLLSLNTEWSDAKILVRSIVEDERERESSAASLSELVRSTRIKAETEVIVKPPELSLVQVMHTYSRHAAAVFLGLKDPDPGTESEYAQRLIEMVEGLNTTIFVHNAGEFAGHLIR
jgi:hypothetical protein